MSLINACMKETVLCRHFEACHSASSRNFDWAQDDGEDYDEEEGLDDELMEDELLDGASEGSDEDTRMGIQRMQVRSIPKCSINSRA